MSKLSFLQEITTVFYVTTSFVTRNYNSMLCQKFLYYKKLQQCVMSLPPLLQETISVKKL